MPLRRRLVVAITGVMLVTLGIGLTLTYAHARRKVDVEMAAALMNGRNIVEREVEELDATPEPARDLPGLVRVFDGHRHIRARLIDADGATLFASTPDEEGEVPTLLLRVLGGPVRTYRREVALSSNRRGAVVLETDARSEVGEVSGDAALDLTVLLILFVLVLAAVNLILARALALFAPLDRAFERIGRGDYAVRVAEAGPPEFARLARSCNAMARELERMDGQTRRLARQLSIVQEEERADLARNLHDEVSPFLFAVEVDARAIRDLSESSPAIAARAEAIGEAAAHLKREVKGLLGRLRPETTPDLGLAETIEDFAARLRLRHPAVAIELDAALTREPDPALAQALHQIAREAIGNALQHGRPTRIEIALSEAPDGLRLRVADDGGGPPAAGRAPAKTPTKTPTKPPTKPPGFGILGMRERVAARGGRFVWRERGSPRGIVVEAVLPVSHPVEVARSPREVTA
ncbi:two-component system sensor histidine kinase UhpB [Methylorubrum rhodinum]|uniref:Two-component system sensor histidine kinase UhpB n=1 Tax=Methylorubrum rhodinum TaxID=29428 RepID=A0A840ZL02_9HYPH|nr:ATP-binding protein [Methylorubrum rhodinum]MBB5757627.1 two-component system sensor histidine kinase UhpB [Methylorubrum rhodinum]